MTKRDYTSIAQTLRYEIDAARANYEEHGTLALTECAKAFARDLGNENARFDGLRFLRAAGLTDEEIARPNR